MSDTATSAQQSAGDTGWVRVERLLPGIVAGVIVLLLVVAVVMLRLYRLGEFPPGILPDAGANGLFALRALQGERTVFFSGIGAGREGMAIYAIALTTSLLGRTLLAIRLPSALASAGTVFVVFWLGQLIFGRDERKADCRTIRGAAKESAMWRGLLIGGVGSGLMAVSISQTIIARTAYRHSFLPLILSLCLALLWWARPKPGRSPSAGHGAKDENQRGLWGIALAGVCAGLLHYTYQAAHLAPLLFFFFGLSFLFPLRWFAWPKAQVGLLKQHLPRLVTFTAAAGLVAAPIFVYLVLHPEDFFIRYRVVGLHRVGSGEDALVAFLRNVWNHALIFGYLGDRTLKFNFTGQPFLNPWEALFFWLGVIMALWRWHRPAYRLLLLWLGVMLLPAILTEDAGAGPSSQRMIGAAPAIYLLIGVGVWEAFRFLKERFFQESNTFNNVIAVLISGMILVNGAISYRTYFQQWGTTYEVYKAYDGEIADAAKMLNAQQADANIVYLFPHFWWHEGFEYLYNRKVPVHFLYTAKGYPSFLPEQVRSTLAAAKSPVAVKAIDWNNDLVYTDDGDDQIVVLLGKYGRYLGSVDYRGFRVHTFTDIDLDHPWTFHDHLEPRTVNYEGGISLHGLAMGLAGKQLSSQQPFNLETERDLWIVLEWQIAPGLEIDYALSLRLHNSEGGMNFQKDVHLLNSDAAHTSHWAADKRAETLYHLDFPADLSAGDYELRMVVYDFDTQKPTVELGVWEPEITLARLRLADVE